MKGSENTDLLTADKDEQIRFFEQEIGPRMQELVNTLYTVVIDGSVANGWTRDQSEWLFEVATVPFLKAILEGTQAEDAIVDAVEFARRAMAEACYVRTLEAGKGHTVAFLSLIELEKQIASRRGEKMPDLPDAWLEQAALSVERAAKENESHMSQINAGYATLHQIGQMAQQSSSR